MRTRNLRKVRSLHQERHGSLHVMTLRQTSADFLRLPNGTFHLSEDVATEYWKPYR